MEWPLSRTSLAGRHLVLVYDALGLAETVPVDSIAPDDVIPEPLTECATALVTPDLQAKVRLVIAELGRSRDARDRSSRVAQAR